MAKTLDIGIALPIEACVETNSVLGQRGSGKTYGAQVMAEEMIRAGVQIVVIDPLDVWNGLRSSADGKSPGLNVVVIGGFKGDLPLQEGSGKLLADFVVEQRVSVVLALRHLSKTKQNQFVADFCTQLYHRKGSPEHRTQIHVFIDEADQYAPQHCFGDQARTLGAVDDLVRRGRSSGIGVTLITQRAAAISKDVLSQTATLICLRTTGPHDRKALEAWIEAHDTGDRRKVFMDSLASLKTGQAWFWAPEHNTFEKITFRRKHTFDSSSTPKAGEIRIEPKIMAPVELAKLKTAMSQFIEKEKANDPKVLKDRIRELERTAAAKPVAIALAKVETKIVEKPVLADGQIERLETAIEKLISHREDISAAVTSITIELQAMKMIRAASKTPVHRSVFNPREGRVVAVPNKHLDKLESNGHLPIGEKAILSACIQFQDGLRRNQLTVLTTYKRSSRDAYIARLAAKGFIETNGDVVTATESGIAALPDCEPLPTGTDLQQHWLGKLPIGERTLLELLIAAYPQSVQRESLSEQTEYQRSSRDAYLARMRAKEIITEPGRGEVRASDTLFE